MSTPGAVRAWESHWTYYRTNWRSNLFGSFLQPFLYLLGMGVGVGSLVDARQQSTELLGELTYYQFLAPALLATTGMMLAAGESLWPVLGGFKWQRFFHAQAQTPLTPTQVANGYVLWLATRAAIGVIGVATVLALFPSSRRWGLLAGVPAGVLTAVAFAAPLVAWASSRETERSFANIMRFGITPLFLFGGAFFPVAELPDWIEPVAWVTPLWHGVELCRGAVFGDLSALRAVLHVAALAGFAAAGLWAAGRTFRTRLAA